MYFDDDLLLKDTLNMGLATEYIYIVIVIVLLLNIFTGYYQHCDLSSSEKTLDAHHIERVHSPVAGTQHWSSIIMVYCTFFCRPVNGTHHQTKPMYP